MALSMRADDRRDSRVLWRYTTEAHKWSVNVTVREGQQHMGRQKVNQMGILINTAHTHTHTAGYNRIDMCTQHALKSHINRQLPATCCECVIVTLWGSVSHKRVII